MKSKISAKGKEMEQEANLFAMLLLMPKANIAQDIDGMDLGDNNSLALLAKKYQVPLTALAVRISLFMTKNI